MDGGLAAGTTLMYDKTQVAANLSYPYFPQDTLNRMVQLLHDTGLQVAVHVSGDQGVDMTLTAFEAAQKNNPRPDPRHRIEHGIFPSTAALSRMKNAGVILSTQPQWIAWHADSYALSVSESSMALLLPLKSLLDMGARVAFGCDVPASIFQEPKWAFYGAVLRKTDSGTVYTPKQALTIQEALRVHTMGSAYASFSEATTGSLEPGKFADMVVWSHDLYAMALADWTKLAADLTIIEGEVIYDSGRLSGKCPCDINGDGSVTVTDFQSLVNSVLSQNPGGCPDINGDGAINILDLQIVISAALDPLGRCRN
jgi:predicted amidohydrolase YtcJ